MTNFVSTIKRHRDEVVAAGVAAAAFMASAQHIYHVTEKAGNPEFVAALHPLGIDGLIYIGIRAVQSGRKVAGFAAIGYGAVYSLAFNAYSYSDETMPTVALAPCMPLAMLFAFLVVHSGHAPEPEELTPFEEILRAEPVVDVKVEWTPPRRPDVVPRGTRTLPIVPRVRPVPTPVVRPVPDVDTKAEGRGRVATWDVERAIRLMTLGRTNTEIAEELGDVSAKPIQRTRRALRLVDTTTYSDAEVGEMCGVSADHVARVRAASAGVLA